MAGGPGFMAGLGAVCSAALVLCLLVLAADQYPNSNTLTLLQKDAVTRASSRLEDAVNSNNLEDLEAAIKKGETVLSSLGRGKGHEQQLIQVDKPSSAAHWEQIAESAAEKAYRIQQDWRKDSERAMAMRDAERAWIKKAKQARARAQEAKSQQLAEKKTHESRLEREKEALKKRLAMNEREMQIVEQMEQHAAAPKHRVQPKQQILRSMPSLPTHLPQSSDPKIKKLEAELHQQVSEYKHARKEAVQNMQQTQDQGKEKEEEEAIKAEIAHYRHARHQLDRQMGIKGPKHPTVSVTAKVHPRRPQSHSILNEARKSLGDNEMSVSAALHSADQVKSNKGKLPGVNSYSWWSMTPEKVAAKNMMAKLKRHEVAPKQKVHNCHNLYSCVGSLFASKSQGSESAELDAANKAWKAKHAQELTKAELSKAHKLSLDNLSGKDRMVSRSTISKNPDQPLLGALEGSSAVHDKKLPGVVESRWGGTKFWDRLLGAHDKSHKH